MTHEEIRKIQAQAAARRTLVARLRAAAPVAAADRAEGAARLLVEAADEIDRLYGLAREAEIDARHTAHDAAVEAAWAERQPEDERGCY